MSEEPDDLEESIGFVLKLSQRASFATGHENAARQGGRATPAIAGRHGACSHRAGAPVVDQTGLNHSVNRRKVPGASLAMNRAAIACHSSSVASASRQRP